MVFLAGRRQIEPRYPGKFGPAALEKSFGQSALMGPIYKVAEQICKLSDAFELFPGDIIGSGMPENVSPVVKGDVI